MKPVIQRWRSPSGLLGWRCWAYPGALLAGIARTPADAYNAWRDAFMDAQSWGA